MRKATQVRNEIAEACYYWGFKHKWLIKAIEGSLTVVSGGCYLWWRVADSHRFSPVVHTTCVVLEFELITTGVLFPVWSSLSCFLAFLVSTKKHHIGQTGAMEWSRRRNTVITLTGTLFYLSILMSYGSDSEPVCTVPDPWECKWFSLIIILLKCLSWRKPVNQSLSPEPS